MEPNFAEKERKIGGRVIIETLYNGISVFVDKETEYYYAGKICSDNGKQFKHLAENQDYALTKQAISSTVGIPAVELHVIEEMVIELLFLIISFSITIIEFHEIIEVTFFYNSMNPL